MYWNPVLLDRCYWWLWYERLKQNKMEQFY